MARLSIPTTARLPSSLLVPSSHPAVAKSLSRLSRESLLSLALDWLQDASLANTAPYLGPNRLGDGDQDDDDDDDDDDHLYPPCRSVPELRELYADMQQQRGSKRDVVSRILEGDWRHGLTLYQLAMIDFSYLDEHPVSHKWTAYRILPLRPPSKDATEEQVSKVDSKSLTIPRFHPSTFLQNLQQQILPDVKAHYHFHRPTAFPVLLLRIFAIESPYNTSLAMSSADASGTTTNFTSSRTLYLAFPDGSPSLYISRSQATGPISLGESKSLLGLIVNGVPKALSRPRQRFTLKSTNLSSRNLDALLDKRGSGRGNAAGGGWSIYADEKNRKSPLDTILPTPPLSSTSSRSDVGRKRHVSMTRHVREAKRAKLVAKARFGESAIVSDGKGVERVEILMQDPFPVSSAGQVEASDDDEQQPGSERPVDRRRSKVEAVLRQARADVEDINDEEDASQWSPVVRLSFRGAHVFAGIRQLVEAGIVDGERMPGWMTGEEGVTTGVVRHGRIRGHKGMGL